MAATGLSSLLGATSGSWRVEQEEFASGNSPPETGSRSILQDTKMCPGIASFSNENESAPFFVTQFSPEIIDVGFAHLWLFPVPFSPSPTPPSGRELTPRQYFGQVALSFDLFFYFAVVVVLYLLVAFSHTFFPHFPSALYFSAQKNLTSIPKKMKLQKLKI